MADAQKDARGVWVFYAEYQELAAVRAVNALEGDGVIREIAAERRRQIEVEGWCAAHDDQHGNAQLARAAAAYAIWSASGTYADPDSNERFRVDARRAWPWSWDWWKPKNRRRDLIRAAALLVAEIERLDRASPAQEG